MYIMDWKNKKVAILGWGVDSQDVEPWLREQGADITILNEKDDPKAFSDLNKYEVVVRSPGVYIYRKELLEYKGVITSKTKIFFDVCPTKNIIGVTGTKGKGTTSTLIYEILKADGRDVYLGGNIGKGCFDFLDKLKVDSWVVLELSSFQLIDLHKSPHIAVTLMVTTEHLDWHKDAAEYVAAKATITKYQGPMNFSIFNDQYPNSVKIGMQGEGKKIPVNRNSWQGETKLRGEHNKENIAAAVAVAEVLSVDKRLSDEAIKNFKGLEHRLEEVATIDGVTYINDSFSTVPETTIAAIKAFNEPMVLIVGGSEKNSDFTELGKTISEAKNIKAVILIGLMAERIENSISNKAIKLTKGLRNMEEIVAAASNAVVAGDVVVLSPACASFDMFKNYKDRGEQFKNEVLKLQ